MFITFEGPEGSGKSTQARLLYEHIQARGHAAILTREPGGTSIGEQIREVLHSHRNHELVPESEFLLYNAARAQIVAQVIRPALARGQIVICDRFADSTIAYQGYGREIDLETVLRVIQFATGGLVPDLTYYLKVPVEQGLARRENGQENGLELNRMDAQSREFYERVCRGYEELMRAEPERWVCVDGTLAVERVQSEIAAAFELAYERHRGTAITPQG
jgi:dTMP kinase